MVAVEPYGDSVVTLTYWDVQGRLGERLLFRDDEASPAVVAQRRGFTFDGDGHLLPRQPLRLVLADDPGAGKTIMAGLYIKERHLLLMTGTPHRRGQCSTGSVASRRSATR